EDVARLLRSPQTSGRNGNEPYRCRCRQRLLLLCSLHLLRAMLFALALTPTGRTSLKKIALLDCECASAGQPRIGSAWGGVYGELAFPRYALENLGDGL